jgi:hypothetical protein
MDNVYLNTALIYVLRPGMCEYGVVDWFVV